MDLCPKELEEVPEGNGPLLLHLSLILMVPALALVCLACRVCSRTPAVATRDIAVPRTPAVATRDVAVQTEVQWDTRTVGVQSQCTCTSLRGAPQPRFHPLPEQGSGVWTC